MGREAQGRAAGDGKEYVKTESLERGYKPWLIASVVLLVGSLMVLAASAAAVFIWYSETGAPLWLIVVAVLGVLGVAAGFAGLIVMMATAGWKSFRDEKATSQSIAEDLSPPSSEQV